MVKLISIIKKNRTPEHFLLDLLHDSRYIQNDDSIVYYNGDYLLFEKLTNGFININDNIWDIFIKKYYLTPLVTYSTIKGVMKQYMGWENIEPLPSKF